MYLARRCCLLSKNGSQFSHSSTFFSFDKWKPFKSDMARRLQACSRSAGYCFTINNYSEDDVKRLDELACKYLVYGKEKGAQGTPHLQGYVHFGRVRPFALVVRLLGGHCHVECAKGSPAENRAYCIKEGNFVERGDVPKQGARTDLLAVKHMIAAGRHLKDIVNDCTSYPAMKSAEFLFKYRKISFVKRVVRVWWFWGPTGAGKTHRAFQMINDNKWNDDVWVNNNSLQWFDGYGGESVVLLDDIRGDDIKFNFLLRLLDVFPLKVPIKGGFAEWCPSTILITTPMHPKDWSVYYPFEAMDQLIRRIGFVVECTREEGVPIEIHH